MEIGCYSKQINESTLLFLTFSKILTCYLECVNLQIHQGNAKGS